MPIELSGRLCAYIRTSAGRHAVDKEERDEMVGSVASTLERLEAGEPGLVSRIEAKLPDDSCFQGSDEQRILTMSITSAIGAGRTPRAGTREESLDGHVLYGGADPAVLAERREESEIIEEAFRRELDALPEPARTIFRRLLDGASQAAISREIGIPTSTLADLVKSKIRGLTDCLRHLRDLYQPTR